MNRAQDQLSIPAEITLRNLLLADFDRFVYTSVLDLPFLTSDLFQSGQNFVLRDGEGVDINIFISRFGWMKQG